MNISGNTTNRKHGRGNTSNTSNTGQVIVLLAGLGGTAHCFDSLAPVLARHARVLAVTRRGYGQSDKPTPSASKRYDPATLVADLIALFDALGIDRALLAGHSIAGNELTLFAGRYPQRVRETNNATYGGALPYNFINPIGVNGAYFYAKLSYTF